MIRAGLVAIAVCVLEATAAAKGGAIALPPMEVDMAATVPIGGGGAAIGPATDLLVGWRWASTYWKPTHYDVGFGYVGSFRPLRDPGPKGDDRFTLNGGFMSLGRTLVSEPHFRTWIEVRGELLRGTIPGHQFSALGAAMRFTAEIFSAGVGGASDHSSIVLFAGTIALGVYIEASHRDIASDLGPTGVTTGVSFRIPFLLAAAS